MGLTNEPQDINKQTWYYEEKKGIGVVHEVWIGGAFIRTEQFTIPWKMIRTSLARKDHRRLPR